MGLYDHEGSRAFRAQEVFTVKQAIRPTNAAARPPASVRPVPGSIRPVALRHDTTPAVVPPPLRPQRREEDRVEVAARPGLVAEVEALHADVFVLATALEACFASMGTQVPSVTAVVARAKRRAAQGTR